MNVIGFDNEKYMREQSRNIRDRIAKFGGKLYLEFGGKLFDDYHASRVLPGFEPDSKVKMLLKMKDEAEIVIAISADDIERNKRRGDLGITYDEDTLRLIDAFRGIGLFVGSVVITHYRSQPAAELFQKRLETLGIKVYRHYIIPDYPSNVELIVSEDGFGKNDYIETERSLVVVTAPGPGSGKMATCLSQLYHEHLRGINAGYAKFETFPIWNIPLKHPINLAYEAATADLDDVNMIDPFHLEAYGETTVNYNRDVEIFPVLNAILTRIYGESAYKSPTARDAGRLTFNPIKHVDIWGLLMMAIFRFGWAKPVPVNMYRFKNPKKGMAVTALAGPACNFLLALLFLFLYGLLYYPLYVHGGAVAETVLQLVILRHISASRWRCSISSRSRRLTGARCFSPSFRMRAISSSCATSVMA